MGIKEWRLEDANRWCGVAVPRLPDASLCSCHISTGLKARGYSFSRLPDGFSLTAHHNDSEPLLVPVLGEILKRVQDDVGGVLAASPMAKWLTANGCFCLF
jgi:hypothetical protein